MWRLAVVAVQVLALPVLGMAEALPVQLVEWLRVLPVGAVWPDFEEVAAAEPVVPEQLQVRQGLPVRPELAEEQRERPRGRRPVLRERHERHLQYRLVI